MKDYNLVDGSVNEEHIISNYLETIDDNEFDLFVKTMEETKIKLKIKRYNPQKLPEKISIITPTGKNADVVKKLEQTSDSVSKLILEARIDIERFVRFIFTFDDDRRCKEALYTFGFEKRKNSLDYFTNYYSLITANVHKKYIRLEPNERSDYFDELLLK